MKNTMNASPRRCSGTRGAESAVRTMATVKAKSIYRRITALTSLFGNKSKLQKNYLRSLLNYSTGGNRGQPTNGMSGGVILFYYCGGRRGVR